MRFPIKTTAVLVVFGGVTAASYAPAKQYFKDRYRVEYQEEGETKRNDKDFLYVSAWEHGGAGEPKLHKEPLIYEEVQPTTRSYK